MPQPVSYNPGTPVSGSIQENSISYVVDGQNRNYRGGFGGLSWMSEVPAENNVIFIGNSTSLGRGPANIPLFYPSYNNSSANIVYAANTLPGSPRNFTTTGSAYNWAVTNNFFINNSDNPIPRIDADSMFLCLDAEQATSFPQTGTSWYDMSGANYTVTGTNNPTWNYGNGRSYWRFDGVDDYFAFSSTPPIAQSTYTSTVEIWAKSVNNVPTFQVMFGGGVQNTNQGYYYGFRQDNANFMYAFHANDQDGATPRDNRVWNHYVAVYNQATGARYRYFNGELLSPSQASGVTATSANSFTIGAYKDPSAGPQHFYNGYISKVRGYSKELTQSEIKLNYFQSNIVQDGLLFMVDANNIVSYEGSGTTSYSLTGSNTATLVNGVGYSSQNGGSFVFDGVDDYIQTNLNQNTDNALITWECWYFDDSPGGYVSNTALISNYGPSGTTPYTLLHVTTAGNVLFGQRSSVGAEASAVYSGNICDGRWHHVVGTVDSTNISMYIDGVYQSSNVKITGVTTSGQNIVIGSNHLDRYQSCRIANARLYNVALTPAQIQQNYQATKDKFQGATIPLNGLVLNLDAANKDSYPGTGTTWTDLSGTGNNATLYNGTNWNSTGYMSTDAVDDYIQIPNAASLQLTTGFTQVIWVKLNNIVTVSYKTLFGKPNYTKYGIIVEWYGGNPILFDFSVSGNRNIIGTLSPGSLGTWIMVAQSYNASGGSNNQIANIRGGTTATSTATRTGNVDTDTSPMNIGQAGLSMDVGMALLYNRGLTQTELDQIYNATKGRFGY